MANLGQVNVAGLGRLVAAVTLSAAFGSAHAQNARDQANNAAIADGVSTAVGLVTGATELTPLGTILGIGAKTAIFHYAEGLPETEQPVAYAAAASLWQGTTANSLCMTAAILTGGSFTPACIALGVAWGVKTWKDSERERRFWERCSILREFADQPNLPCVYTPPETELAAGAGSELLTMGDVEAP